MTIRERLGAINRMQHGLWFKVVATCVIAALAIGAGVAYRVAQAASPMPMVDISGLQRPQDPGKDAKLTPEQRQELDEALARYEATEATARTINDILARKADPTVVYAGIGSCAALAIGVVWLGIGLTVLGVAAASVLPLAIVLGLGVLGVYRGDHDARFWPNLGLAWRGMSSWPLFVAAAGTLALSFFILMELLKLALSGPWAVLAIARNVVSEAVRMKVSLVFMVLLVLGLAALPGLLDPTTPLRYRVQSFLQYGTGGTFWIIALLVLFLSVGSVAFEQRDRIIWQTMTKPVAPWQYILGKWLGVVGLAAVLLSVTASGVFLFTGYLRNQPAMGESQAYVARDSAISEDRLVLETQVLAARTAIGPTMPEPDEKQMEGELKRLIDRAKEADPHLIVTDEFRQRLADSIKDDWRKGQLTIEPGQRKDFVFTGLREVKESNRPMTLRYKVSIGADDPRGTARVTFWMPNTHPRVQEVPLGQSLTIPVTPASIEIVKVPVGGAGDGAGEGRTREDGILQLTIVNGDFFMYQENPNPKDGEAKWYNAEPMSIPPDGLEISYAVGGYEANFLRVMVVLWLKLAFLAMVGVWAATYLSFAVASLIAFATFLIAESATFLSTSLEYFNADDGKGNIEYWKIGIRAISVPIAWIFKHYSDLRPTANLVDGRIVDWGTVAVATVALAFFTALLYGVGVWIFKHRELATYSGQ